MADRDYLRHFMDGQRAIADRKPIPAESRIYYNFTNAAELGYNSNGDRVTVTQSGRVSEIGAQFSQQTFVPGSNNGHTAGRNIDPYVRK